MAKFLKIFNRIATRSTTVHGLLSSFPFILYNDSVVFENIGGFDERGFPDKDKFQSLHN